MNEYIIFTPEGYTTAPNENYEVENCQVLGIASGRNERDAINNLIIQNQWITEAGFNPTEFFCKRLAK